MSMSKVCEICAESFNKTSRAVVKCVCDFECCRSCAKVYLLGRAEDASCMSCKVSWGRKFMSEYFEKSFMNRQYKDHREEVLVEREMGMLQATQPYVEKEIRIEKLNEDILILRSSYYAKLSELQNELSDLMHSGVVEKKKFVRKCPNGSCHGFLSSSLKCELCGCFACGECREVKGFTTDEKESHECNKDILESVKLLEKDSKPCPNCASLTFKTIGCNSMWCVECHASWNWVSGKIETGTIHNPEYFDWLKKQKGAVPRNPLDVQCGRELDNQFVIRLMDVFEEPLPTGWKKDTRNMRGAYGERVRQIVYISPRGEVHYNHPGKATSSNNFVEIARNIIHIRFVESPRFQAPDRLQDNLQMRIDYMRNKIEKEEFKKKIQKKEKENEKKREINNILGMYMNCMTDIFYRLTAEPKQKEIIKIEMEGLRKYVNESLARVSITYNCKKYEINKEYIFC